MCENDHHFVEWKEHFVSQERGNRVVHYFLKDSAGESILAVVGTERSVRHMFYVVSEDFVRIYGSENSIHAGFKWRSRREVVDWLTSMLSKQNTQGNWSKSPKCESGESNGSPEIPSNGFAVQRAQAIEEVRLPINLRVHSWEIMWSGTSWMCGKQLKHYPSFCRNGTTIGVQSFVFVMSKGEDRYVAYLEDMYEDKRGLKKVKVRWFHYTKEVKGAVALKNPNPKEVFITPHSQVISAECVDGPATVLTREHYEECVASFPNSLLAKVHMCYRQLRNNKVKPFNLSKLRGYLDQPIMACLSSMETGPVDCNKEEDAELSEGENVMVGAERSKRKQAGMMSDHLLTIYESSCKRLRLDSSGKRFPSPTDVQRHPCYNGVIKADAKIEFLCQDSGIRGCWFRCTVLEVSRKQVKLQYDDIEDEDGFGNLEEWVPAFKSAMPDKLGIRSSNRPTIRPAPPDAKPADFDPTIGEAVDAWWNDGWWEGVVIATDKPDAADLQIYIPGENLCLTVHRKDIRISRDWVGDSWVDIEPKPEILSLVSTDISPGAKLSTSSTLAKDAKAVHIPMPDIVEADKPEGDKAETSLLGEVDKENKDDEVVKEDDESRVSKDEDKEAGSNQSNTYVNHENTVQDHKEEEDDVTVNDEKARKTESVFTLSKTTTTLVTT
uniref:BAH domain-containing protein n=1 Tax=Noccaea caerulescens TaxID=107243 RepID=A0A1J3I3I8_NOCCA